MDDGRCRPSVRRECRIVARILRVKIPGMKVPAVKILIAANVLVYAVQFLSHGLIDQLALWPIQPIEGHVYFKYWQILTYAFLHDTGSIFHLLFNMLGLWMFGSQV